MDSVEIAEGFRAVGLTLHAPSNHALILADTHLGYECALNREGVLVPRFQYRDVARHLAAALALTNPKTVVVDGDLKHGFGSISPQEWAETRGFLSLLVGRETVLVKGNHDTVLGPIAEKKGVRVVGELRLGDTLIIHGHRKPKSLRGVKTIVIGHEHPCVGLSEEGRTEKVKCFLVGAYMGCGLIVLPSFNFVTEGVDVLKERLLSPMLQGDLSDFKAWGVEDGRILYFGRLGGINTA